MNKLLALFAILALATSAFASNLVPVDVRVQNAIDNNDPIDVILNFETLKLNPKDFEHLPRPERRVAVRDVLRAHALKTQALVAPLLKGAQLKSHWINNSIVVRSAPAALLRTLRNQRSILNIESVRDVAHIDLPILNKVTSNAKLEESQWNILVVRAPETWAAYTSGEGVTIANIDTGVRYTHEAVVDSYRGNNGDGTFDHDYNWLDPRGQQIPFDNNGHGTHTMGSIAGSVASGVGVAPGAKWIAAKGCASGSCSNADLIASAEWVICPTKQDGSAEDCTKGADVVSNSWGGGSDNAWYHTYVDAWVAAGSIPVFSQGNSGPSCGSANSPGDYDNVIGVGATDINNALASFSSRGPGGNQGVFPKQKPDISGPGEQIRSAYHTSDYVYVNLSGTSMSCPHVAGVAGLVLSVNPNLTYEQLKTILYTTAITANIPAPKGAFTSCDGVSYTTWPNYFYGHGIVDSFAAAQAAAALL